MADTIITPSVQSDNGANAMGWAVAVILLLGLIFFGLFVWPGMRGIAPATNTSPGIDVNVRLPEGVVPSTGAGNTTPQPMPGGTTP